MRAGRIGQRAGAVALAALCLAGQAAGPVAAQQEPEGQEVTFSTSAQLVVLNVIARDRRGAFIEGLRQEDFTVTEDGKPQQIALFEFQRLERRLAPKWVDGVPPANVEPDVGEAEAAGTEGAGPPRYRDRRLMVVCFDQSSLGAAELMRAKDAMRRYLREQMSVSDVVAVYTYDEDLLLLQDFTSDRALLMQAVESIEIPALDEDLGFDEDDTGGGADFAIFNSDRKLSSIQRAVKTLGTIPERKAFVLFSGGAGMTGLENASQLRSVVNDAVRANVAFFPVDARGLVAQAPLGDASVRSPGGEGMYSGDSQRQRMISLSSQADTLAVLAQETGGRALMNTNDLGSGLLEAQDALSSYYIIGYYSTNEELDGKFRRVRVQTARRVAANLDYRRGYYASKEFRRFNEADRERQLQEALDLDTPVTDLPIAIEVNHFWAGRDRYYVPVAVKIPGRAIRLARKGQSDRTRMDFIGQVTNVVGTVSGSVRDNVEIKLDAESAAEWEMRNLQYDTAFVLTPGPYKLKFLARENETGLIGTFETVFTIPDLATETDYLPVSTVVLAYQRESVASAVGGVGRRGSAQADNPLIRDGLKLMPSVTRVFRRSTPMYVYLETYGAVAKPLQVTVSFYRGGVKAFESERMDVNGTPGVLPVSTKIALDGIRAGRYTCQVNVLDPAGRKFAFWRSTVFLLP